MTSVETIDFDAVFDSITARLKEERTRRFARGKVQLWDGNMNRLGTVHLENSASFQEIENETGMGKLEMPAQYYLSKILTRHVVLITAAARVDCTVGNADALCIGTCLISFAYVHWRFGRL